MPISFQRVQPTFETLAQAREQFARLQDSIATALQTAQQSSAVNPLEIRAPGGAALAIANGPAGLSSASPAGYVRLPVGAGRYLLVPGWE